MIGLNEDGIPMIHLYRSCNGQTVMVNRELVDRYITILNNSMDLAKGHLNGNFPGQKS